MTGLHSACPYPEILYGPTSGSNLNWLNMTDTLILDSRVDKGVQTERYAY